MAQQVCSAIEIFRAPRICFFSASEIRSTFRLASDYSCNLPGNLSRKLLRGNNLAFLRQLACKQNRGSASEKIVIFSSRKATRLNRDTQCFAFLQELDQTFILYAAVCAFMLPLPAYAVQGLMPPDLDPSVTKLAITILGPLFTFFNLLFIVRIVMSWYPNLPLGKFPYVIAYLPTEPFLSQTRKVIPPVAGVDISPVVWFGIISFLNETLLGSQGLLVLISQQRP